MFLPSLKLLSASQPAHSEPNGQGLHRALLGPFSSQIVIPCLALRVLQPLDPLALH